MHIHVMRFKWDKKWQKSANIDCTDCVEKVLSPMCTAIDMSGWKSWITVR